MPGHGEIYDLDVDELECSDTADMNTDSPRTLGVTLLPHQRRALHSCRDMENADRDIFFKTSIGVYADPVGSGKSHVMLALIISDLGLQSSGPGSQVKMRTFADGRIRVSEIERMVSIKTSIIVIPHTLAFQWERYLMPLTGAGMRIMIVDRLKAIDRLASSDIGEIDIILVTNSFYESIAHLCIYRGVKPRRLIIDEADTITLPSSICIEARFTWFVTASYGNLLFPMGGMSGTVRGISRNGFIRVLFLGLYTNMTRRNVKRLVVRNSEASVTNSMQSIPVIHVTVPSQRRHSSEEIDEILMQCLNSGDIASAVEQIAPDKLQSAHDVLRVMSARWKEEMDRTQMKIDGYTRAGQLSEVTRLTTVLQGLEHKITCMTSRLLDDEPCCICLEQTQVNAVVPCCVTKMCLECVARWILLSHTCVLCRRPLEIGDLHVIREERDDYQMYGRHNTKLENMEVIMRMLGEAKVLIYCDERVSPGVSTSLRRMGMSYEYIRGGHRQISNTIDAYKDDRIDVLLISEDHYGVGLSLENTTDIIIFGTMKKEVETEVIGRAQRIGRLGVLGLRVWHLRHHDET